MRRFIHKTTGEIVNKITENFYQIINTPLSLKKEWVENSNDWEEIFENEDFYPIGTKIKDSLSFNDDAYYIKVDENKWVFFDSKSKVKYTIFNSEIGIGKRFQVVEVNSGTVHVEYDLSYEDLKNGIFYTTEYPEQGKYTFRQGYHLFYSHRFRKINKSDSNFTPKNGFHFFREATKEEIDFFQEHLFIENGNKKEFEILSVVKHKDSKNFIPIVNGSGNVWHYSAGIRILSLKTMLENNFFVYQVKRLSDGEVFTVGDRIKGYKNTGIKEIKIEYGEISIITDANGDGCVTDNLSWNLESCHKINKVFKTVDDVWIYEGDNFFEANVTHGVKVWNTDYPVYLNNEISKTLFADKQKAEEFVLMNKKALSIKDVQSIYVSANGNYKKNGNGENYLEKLKDIVKKNIG